MRLRRFARRIRSGGGGCLRTLLFIWPFGTAVLVYLYFVRTSASHYDAHSVTPRGLFKGKYDPGLATTDEYDIPFWAPDLDPQIRKGVRGPPLLTEIPKQPNWFKKIATEMRFAYLSDEKIMPYVGSSEWMEKFRNGTRGYFNSMAVFPKASDKPDEFGITRMHGVLGVDEDANPLWKPASRPPPANEYPGGLEAALKNGGFYLNLSNAMPLDREVPDFREAVCKAESFDLTSLPDASVVITFYNEPLSTLLRSVHSVLNRTPPPILREIILVDDHSNLTENLPGSSLYYYLKTLPKTKLIRLGERKGLVHARLAGARAASGKVLVVLDSHIEVNAGWLEPMLNRIAENPSSIVFPQILAINPETFQYDTHSGIGCRISFRWSMVEQSSLAGKVTDPAPVESPSMAGGLFAADLDYFWHLGGYDEGFSMWGAENVEMGFRTWQCGGRMECLPCSKTFHIYRKKGHGYESPHDAIVRNRLRAARVWTDEFYAIAELFIRGKELPDMGSLDKMLALKERLQCKPFKWFLDNIDPGHSIQSSESIEYHGYVQTRNLRLSRYCLDTMSKNEAGEEFGIFPCHGEGGTQNWVKIKETNQILPVCNERLCLSAKMKFETCTDAKPATATWIVEDVDRRLNIVRIKTLHAPDKCLTAKDRPTGLAMENCEESDQAQSWYWTHYTPQEVPPLTFSEEYLREQEAFKAPWQK